MTDAKIGKKDPRDKGRREEEIPPEEKWWADFSKRCAAAESAAGVLDLLRLVLAEAPPIDEDGILDHLSPPLHRLADAGLHAEVIHMVDALAARFPEEIGAKNAYFERLRFESALERADMDLVAESVARDWAPQAAADRWLRESMALFRTTILEIRESNRGALERELLAFTQARS